MQTVLQTLLSILKQEKCILASDSVITIAETGKEATLKKVQIISAGQNAFAVKFDQCGFPGQKVFVDQHDMHSACDAIIFCLLDTEPFILCCELKSSEPKKGEITKQFKSAQCFLDYLDSLLSTYHNLSIKDWSRRYFLFHDRKSIPLRKSVLVNQLICDSPEKADFLPVDNCEKIYLRKLLNKVR